MPEREREKKCGSAAAASNNDALLARVDPPHICPRRTHAETTPHNSIRSLSQHPLQALDVNPEDQPKPESIFRPPARGALSDKPKQKPAQNATGKREQVKTACQSQTNETLSDAPNTPVRECPVLGDPESALGGTRFVRPRPHPARVPRPPTTPMPAERSSIPTRACQPGRGSNGPPRRIEPGINNTEYGPWYELNRPPAMSSGTSRPPAVGEPLPPRCRGVRRACQAGYVLAGSDE